MRYPGPKFDYSLKLWRTYCLLAQEYAAFILWPVEVT
jgi:hypothetical protein